MGLAACHHMWEVSEGVSRMRQISSFDSEGIMLLFLGRVRYDGINNDFSFGPVDSEDPPIGHPVRENQ